MTNEGSFIFVVGKFSSYKSAKEADVKSPMHTIRNLNWYLVVKFTSTNDDDTGIAIFLYIDSVMKFRYLF